MTPTIAVTSFVVGLIVSVALHEAGHLSIARWFGMRADRFFVGFGPTVFSFRRGEVEYGLKWILAGGYVKINGMVGDRQTPRGPVWDDVFPDQHTVDEDEYVGLQDADDRLFESLRERGVPRVDASTIVGKADLGTAADDADARRQTRQAVEDVIPDDGGGLRSLTHRLYRGDEGRMYRDGTPLARIAAIMGGPGANFVVAFLLFVAVNAVFGLPDGFREVTAVSPDSGAEAAGVQVGDVIVSIDGEPVDHETFSQAIASKPPTADINFTVERDGELVDMAATLQQDGDRGYLGVVAATTDTTRNPLTVASESAVGDSLSVWSATVDITRPLLTALGTAVTELPAEITGSVERDEGSVVSLVGIGRQVSQSAADFGWADMAVLLAYLNILLGVFNLIPVLPLDGGHAAVVVIEVIVNKTRSVFGRAKSASQTVWRVPEKAQIIVAASALSILVLMFLASAWLDVVNPVVVG